MADDVLPPGLSVDPFSGELHGIPQEVGTFYFDVTLHGDTDPLWEAHEADYDFEALQEVIQQLKEGPG